MPGRLSRPVGTCKIPGFRGGTGPRVGVRAGGSHHHKGDEEMSKRKNLVAGAVVLSLAGLVAGHAVAGTISGTVTYEGKVPSLKPIAMDADPAAPKRG